MTVGLAWFLGLLWLASVALAAWGVAICVRKPRPGSQPLGVDAKLLRFSGTLIGAIWCIRFAVGLYTAVTSEQSGLSWWEEMLNSIAHTLQTFSMDEDYTQYILDGKAMMRVIFGPQSPCVWLYGLYAAVLNLAAPVAGGAIVFEILARIFPRIRLWAYGLSAREKYYFSELNARSLALAKNIVKTYADKPTRPVVIFTDVYTDDESESSTELLLEAKQLGAVCVRDDLAHVRKTARGLLRFFLIDEVEIGNLQTLSELSNEHNYRYMDGAEIYLFCQDDIYTQVVAQFRERLEKTYHFAAADADGDGPTLPVVVPVQGKRNLIGNLLTELPLYETLIHKPRNEDGTVDLNVTVLGTGTIGTEMVLSAYWFGQMLDCRLTVTVVSLESEESFFGRLDHISPELRRAAKADDPILRYDRRGGMAPPYCRIRYIRSDVKQSGFSERLRADSAESLLDTDYFMVALGSDELNLSVAEKLYRCVGEYHLTRERQTVIAYVVFDDELSRVLNQEKHRCSRDGHTVDIYMQAVGSLSEVYSVRNVFMTEHRAAAESIGEMYEALHDREGRVRSDIKRRQDEYSYQADLARAMHIGYKIFSLGLPLGSVFDTDTDREALWNAVRRQYKRLATGAAEDGDVKQRFLRELHRLAWLEHRRWCAFMRTRGFRGTQDYLAYRDRGKGHKHLGLKLHPCILECSQNGMPGAIFTDGLFDATSEFGCTDAEQWDRLDEVSYTLKEQGYEDAYDFKRYDYPQHDFKKESETE